MKLKVAVTGNIGSGKSTVVEVFKSIGIPVFNSDIEAKKLYDIPEVKDKVRHLFGDEVFTKDEIDRKKLGHLIFNDKIALQKINELVHPLILAKYKEWHDKQESPYTIEESAIIFENKLQDNYDIIINVTAPESTRIERVVKRDNCSVEDVKRRIDNQMSDALKCNLSNFVINSDGIGPLKPQVKFINDILINFFIS